MCYFFIFLYQQQFLKHKFKEPTLFNLTIAENIGYGMKDVRMDEIIEAAKLANIHNFIDNLPEVASLKITVIKLDISRATILLLEPVEVNFREAKNSGLRLLAQLLENLRFFCLTR